VALGCTVHEQMSAYVVVVDTPYFATSDKRGKSSIENVEPGEYKLRIWYPQMSKEPAAQSVRVGDEAKLAVTVTTD
jgi:hypothetical protein